MTTDSGYETFGVKDLRVFYTPALEGGGTGYGQDYVRIVSARFPRQRRIFEWCAGPGFIGFSLIAHGLCDTLCLADVNPRAVAACRRTIEANGLADRVTVYLSDCLDAIPKTERWTLVVGNPPHSGAGRTFPGLPRPPLIYRDDGWRIHQRFYGSVGRFLEPDGALLILENGKLSTVETFRGMIGDGGFRIVDTSPCLTARDGSPIAETTVDDPIADPFYYYISAVRAHGTDVS
jgi:methylase of polypeptide subunit release factors